jgi:hypothetical protein
LVEAQNHPGGDLPPLPHGHVCCVIDSSDERAHRVAARSDAGLPARQRVEALFTAAVVMLDLVGNEVAA